MSSSATIVNDRKHGDCAQQPSTATGRLQGTQRQLPVNQSLPSADVDRVAAAATRQRTPSTPDVEQGTGTTNARCPSQRKRQPPITAAEPGTGAENMRRTKQRATPTAAVQSSTGTEISRVPSQMRTHTPIVAVEPGTSAGNTRRTKQRTTPTAAVQLGNGTANSRQPSQRRTAAPIAAVEPSTGADNMRRAKKRTTATTAVQSGRRERNSTHKRAKSSPRMTDEEEGDAEEDNNRPKRQPIFERDLTPEQRDIPDTELLHRLGYHLSAYARAGLFWAFEYLDVSRPEHHDADVFPRARRWICPKGSTNNESTQFLANRCKLNFVEESQVTWQPYLSSAIYGSDVLMYSLFLSKRRVPFQGIGTWEYYLGERCRRQLGFRCQVPNDPPQMMHGPKDRPEDVRAVTLVKVGLDYASWFANNSIGNILNVTRSLGGPEIAGKVIDQWLAKHQPNLILVEQSQYEKIKEDRNALEEECAKLREELREIYRCLDKAKDLLFVLAGSLMLPAPYVRLPHLALGSDSPQVHGCVYTCISSSP
uniref:Aminotransferase-like plant mobile domain-containing protein n=1 Tax=Daucus carota subsp. sativus TaxID=79200 RepID=A0A165A8P5_DAUCS